MKASPTLVHRTLDLHYRTRHRASRSSVVRPRRHHQWIPGCPGAASSCAISACHLAVTSVLSAQTKCASSPLHAIKCVKRSRSGLHAERATGSREVAERNRSA